MDQKRLNEIAHLHEKWLRSEHGGKQADLSFLDLSGLDLSFLNLIGVDLTNTNLTKASIIHTDLVGANLTNSNLYGAKLIDVDLTGSCMKGVNLIEAKLIRVDLTEVDLTDSILSHVNLRDAELVDAIGIKYAFLYLGKHVIQYNIITGDCGIGCIYQHIDEWLKTYESIGKENHYSESEIELYGQTLKFLKTL